MLGKTDKCIFWYYGIVKTATTSIYNVLEPYAMKDNRKHHPRFATPDKFNPNEIFKFAIIRNPWDRIYSLWKWGRQISNKKTYDADFNLWVLNTWQNEENLHRISQLEWMKDKKGNIDVDFIGRFEKLEFDWRVIQEKIGIMTPLPHLYQTKGNNYKKFYNEESIEFVRNKHKDDIVIFNYEY
jgi:hypothetical protein